MSGSGDPVPAENARYSGRIGRFVIPGLTGIAASGLLVAAWAAGTVEPQAGPLVLVVGALFIGIVIGNPGNEAILLTGIVLPGALLVVFEPHHGCVARLGAALVLNVGLGIGLMFIGLIVGLMVGRRARIGPVGQRVAVAVLGASAALAAAAWVALGASLSSSAVC
jgi:hypothetical protein